MFNLLLTCAGMSLLAHCLLLLTSFSNDSFHPRSYAAAQAALWITGILVFCLVLLYEGRHRSFLLDMFDTPIKKIAILMATLSISQLVHGIVKFVVVPDLEARYHPERSL